MAEPIAATANAPPHPPIAATKPATQATAHHGSERNYGPAPVARLSLRPAAPPDDQQ